MEEEIKFFIKYLIAIHGEKKFSEKNSNYQNIILIIKGLIEEVRTISVPLISEILINLIKSQSNKEKYTITFKILHEVKNILSAPLNQFIFQLAKTDKELARATEVQKISGEDFSKLIKTICKISNEYLINFLSTINHQDSLKKGKIRDASYLDIFIALFSTSNSLQIAKDYSSLFVTLLDGISSKLMKENDKFSIFKCLCRFIYLNKKEIKKTSLYQTTLDKIKNYIEEIKSENSGIMVLDFITEKYILKHKKIPIKIINFTQTFLDSKFTNLVQSTVEFNFNIIFNKIIKTTQFYDILSTEKKKNLIKNAFLFNNLITKYDTVQSIRQIFNEKLFEIIHIKNVDAQSRVLVILFLVTLSDYKANSLIHKFFIECLDTCSVVIKYCQVQADPDVSSIPLNENYDLTLLMDKSINISTKIGKNIEINKTKLDQTGFVNKLVNTYESVKNEVFNIFLLDQPTNNFFDKITNENSNFTENDVSIFKKAFMILIRNSEIESITDFGLMLINNIEAAEDKQSVNNEVEIMQSLLSLVFYFVKLNVNFILIADQNNDHLKLTFLRIIEFIESIMKIKIYDKDIMNYVTAITKLIFELRNEELIQKAQSILNKLADICFESNEISIKYLSTLFYSLNRIGTATEYIFPKNFEDYLFTSDSKLMPIKFINELLKLNTKDRNLNEVIFSENTKTYILNDLSEFYENHFTNVLDKLNENDLSEIKKELIEIICIQHEILKYEFYEIICRNYNLDLNLDKSNFDHLLKKIFNKIYEFSNFNEDIDDKFPDKQFAKMIKNVNNLRICKMTNLIFKHFKNGISIKPNHQIKLMNLAIFDEVLVRANFIKKIEKCLVNKTAMYYQLHSIPVLMVFFNDPDKEIKKKAQTLFAIFIKYLLNKHEQFDTSDKTKSKNVMYKYLPEVYISYLIMYFVFNFNLNLYYQSEGKFFENSVTTYLKLLKKVSNGNYDSNFLIQNCLLIKATSLVNKKVIKKISHVTYLKSSIKKDNYSISANDLEKVKNDLCNFIIKCINMEFTTKFKYEEFKPNLPMIFTNEVAKKDNTQLDLEISKIDYQHNTSNISHTFLSNKAVRSQRVITGNESEFNSKLYFEENSEMEKIEQESLPFVNNFKENMVVEEIEEKFDKEETALKESIEEEKPARKRKSQKTNKKKNKSLDKKKKK